MKQFIETALTTIRMVFHSDTFFFLGKCNVASLSVVHFYAGGGRNIFLNIFLRRRRGKYSFKYFLCRRREEYSFEVCTMGCNRILSTPLARPGPNLKFEMNIVRYSVY